MRRTLALKVWASRATSLARGILVALLLHREWRDTIRPKVPRRRVTRGEPLRVALVSEYYYPVLGGITEHVHHFARHLLQAGHEVTIFTPEAGPFGRDTGEVGRRVVKVGRSVPVYSNDSYARMSLGRRLGETLQHLFEEGNFDLVHVHSPFTPTLPLLAIKYSPVPVVGTFHTHFEENLGMSLLHPYLRPYLEALALRIAVSPVCIRSLERYFGDLSFVVVPNGIDTGVYHPEGPRLPEFEDGSFNVLYVGRFDPRNGLETLLQAFAHLARERPNLRLIVVGFGPLEEYYRRLVPPELRSRVIFAGRVDEERPLYYRTAQVLCFPAKKGSFGITLLEAMACGTPVVTTDIEGFRFVMTPGEHGLMVPPDSGAQGYARALAYLMDHPQERRAMARKARERALSFSWERVSQTVLDYYYQILGA
ncbi:glycosyltransferase family 4 protein [Thermosulfurimonas marina]|uniref:Glycosyltransferase family 4 protein n=1 Tax=Thermosulfurimonas marina TaxID=2047767 RepID=A0A6H1WTX2_9BACT|nr:glycosyltransferase family 4 protein [Thermosulfurimonas marina]QJA06599.1 glycosyltransferase family 4 protein [Thermosulfurimonas marina]